MEGTLVLNFILLLVLSAVIGFGFGYLARTLSQAPRQRADNEDISLMRRFVAGDEGLQP